jgi:hypothetical protein
MTHIKEHNVETGEIIEREMTAAEIKQQEKDLANVKAIEIEKAERAAKRSALLEKLGITEEEAAVLLG